MNKYFISEIKFLILTNCVRGLRKYCNQCSIPTPATIQRNFFNKVYLLYNKIFEVVVRTSMKPCCALHIAFVHALVRQAVTSKSNNLCKITDFIEISNTMVLYTI